MNKDTIQEVKTAMGYRDGTECCKGCRFFVPSDLSGNEGAKTSHCTVNTFELPVIERGYCDHFEAK